MGRRGGGRFPIPFYPIPGQTPVRFQRPGIWCFIQKVATFAASVAHSVVAVKKRKVTPTCASTAIGIGNHVKCIDDVEGHVAAL